MYLKQSANELIVGKRSGGLSGHLDKKIGRLDMIASLSTGQKKSKTMATSSGGDPRNPGVGFLC